MREAVLVRSWTRVALMLAAVVSSSGCSECTEIGLQDGVTVKTTVVIDRLCVNDRCTAPGDLVSAVSFERDAAGASVRWLEGWLPDGSFTLAVWSGTEQWSLSVNPVETEPNGGGCGETAQLTVMLGAAGLTLGESASSARR